MDDPRAVVCSDGFAASAFDDVELEGVRRAMIGYRSTHTTARLLATVDVLRDQLAVACERLEGEPDVVDA